MKKFDNYILITDLDGTLLTEDGTVSEKNIEAINYFRKNGGKFTIATGRTVNRTSFLLDDVDIDLPGIFSNGSVIAELKNKKVLWQKNIHPCAKKIICDYNKKHPECSIIVCNDEKDYFINPGMFKSINSDLSGFNYYECDTYNLPDSFYKIVIVSGEDVMELLKREYNGYLDKIYFTKSNTFYYEIVDNSVSKGVAVNELKKMFNLYKKRIIAVGDNHNDIEFLEVSDIGVAVANGCGELLKRADFILPHEDIIYNLIAKLS